MNFEQATIKVEKQEEYAKLQGAIESVFVPQNAERFLKEMDRKNVRIRDFDGMLAARVLEYMKESQPGLDGSELYRGLPVSDQAQMREFYLSKLEAVGDALRHKFKKLYQYY